MIELRSSMTTAPQAEPDVACEVTEEGPWRVVLFNDQVHTMHEVVMLLMTATNLSVERCVTIMMEAHVAGRAEVIRTSETRASRIVEILTQGGLLAAMRRS
jgi:ATP-dependent Clp protease adapter protein ClpS